jgi:DnaJ-domain-containing protein 1
MPRRQEARIELEGGPRARKAQRACDHPGCKALGEFRAPRARQKLNDYYWFCLEHVRAYNQAWDFYKDMSPEELERERRADIAGHRPTWPMGSRGGIRSRRTRMDYEALAAELRRIIGDDAAPRREKPRPKISKPEEEARKVLGVGFDASFAEIKSRYRVLAKQHHPDANGGDKGAEERLKVINQAYSFLKSQASGGSTAAHS